MYCTNCGTEMNEGTKFCQNCGANVTENNTQEKESIVLECKGSLQGGGVGKIVLTNKNIIWTKSKGVNFLMGGVMSLVTKGDTAVDLNQIMSVDTYLFLGGGGLKLVLSNGKTCKFGFNSTKDRDTAMEYIKNKLR